ncbi:hypothetical protein J6590_063188 [Homalodisca vitripennis]|nr:hypothetical protein J6590_063188 [Homalodisca vitripennis]
MNYISTAHYPMFPETFPPSDVGRRVHPLSSLGISNRAFIRTAGISLALALDLTQEDSAPERDWLTLSRICYQL